MEILVEGCAERRVRPERGELRLGLEHEGDNREFVVDLTADLARRFSEAVAPLHPQAVVSWGLEPVRVCTWRSQRRGALRYRASAEATVVFRDFQALADFAVGWGAAPGVEVRHTSWKLTPETEQRVEDELLTEAVQAARRRADIMARAAGAEVSVCVELSDRRPEPQLAHGEVLAVAAAAPEGVGGVVEPDEICRAVSVHGRFRTE